MLHVHWNKESGKSVAAAATAANKQAVVKTKEDAVAKHRLFEAVLGKSINLFSILIFRTE